MPPLPPGEGRGEESSASGSILWRWLWALAPLLVMLLAPEAAAHDVPEGDQGYIEATEGVRLMPFAYLGAKHMVTGLDHVLFLVGIVFFLYRLRDVGLYVTLFAVGHSVTLIGGVLAGVGVSAHLVDAVIGLSVSYKALDNLGAFERWFGASPDARVATFVFGLFHGLGLATKMLQFELPTDGLLANLIAFNVGVEAGQVVALAAILIAMGAWRRTASFSRHAYAVNVAVLVAGFVLAGVQVAGYVAAA